MLWSQYWFLCTAQENLAFLPSFCYCFLTKSTQKRHTQKERGSSSSKITFLCLTSLCGEEQTQGRGYCAQASLQPGTLCQQHQPRGVLGTSFPSHTGKDMQGLHTWTHQLPAPASAPTGLWAKAATPVSPAGSMKQRGGGGP